MGLFKSKLSVLTTETPISDYVPYSHHVTDTIISTKNAEYLSIWKLSGRSHQSASLEDVYSWVRDLNNTLRGIATANIVFYSHIVRRKVSEYPDAEFDNAFCQTLNDKYKESFTNLSLMVNDLYFTVVYRPAPDKIVSILSKAEKPSLDDKLHWQQRAIKTLDEINATLGSALRKYDPELLSAYEHNGRMFSSVGEFLSYLLNGSHKRVPITAERLCEYLPQNRISFSKWGEIGEIRTVQGSKYFGMVEVKEYDDSTEPGHFNTLLESPYEFILTQSFACLSRHAAKGYLQRHQKNLIDANDVAVRQIDEINVALDQLVSGQFIMGEHHCTLQVTGESAIQVREYLAQASAAFMDVGVIPKVVDLALEAAYWAQLPCNLQYRPRPAAITSLNFLSFSPFHNFMSGKPTGNPWGNAVTIFKTISGTPLYFNFHASRIDEDATDKRLLGNTAIIGQSSSGKTVLIGFLLAQSQKLKPTIIAFDKDRGMEIVIRAMGGCYLPLKTGVPSGFNPFQLEPTSANLIFLKQLITKLVSGNGADVSHSDETIIDQALQALMQGNIEKPFRSLSMLLQFLPNPHQSDDNARPTVHARLQKWCRGGEFGWLFDNAEDALDLTSHAMFGFDITDFLDNPDTRTAVMMYLLHRCESIIDGRRFMYVFDEFWKPLQDPYFEDLAKNKQKTIRKQNGIFVFATQEPSDALESPIAKTLIQQSATWIFLANPKADYQDYVEGFKLTDSEFDLVKNIGEFSRRFLIKQGDNCALAELNLNGFDEELLVLSGTPDNAQMVEEIIAEHGDDPNIWLPIFYLNHFRKDVDHA